MTFKKDSKAFFSGRNPPYAFISFCCLPSEIGNYSCLKRNHMKTRRKISRGNWIVARSYYWTEICYDNNLELLNGVEIGKDYKAFFS